MEKTLRFVLLFVASFVLAITAASVVNSKPEYTKKEKTPCTTCHVKTGSKDLNDVGKCYGEKHTLDGCLTPK